MLGRLCGAKFEGFGPCAIRRGRTPNSDTIALASEPKASRQLLRSRCPARPGVYGMIDADDQLIYVGVSRSLRHRLLSYLQSQPEGAKPRRIIARTLRLTWEPAPHELAAHLRELELIRRWTPRFNVRGLPGRLRRGYICVGRAPATHVYLAPQPSARSQDCFGPVPATHRMRQAVERLNDVFRLRDCTDRSMYFSNQLELFAEERAPQCMRYELDTCLGPCAGLCSELDYARQVRAARAFLRGKDDALLPRLQAAMLGAAAQHQFERAAKLRDLWQELAWLDEQVARIAMIRREYSFVYPTRDHAGRAMWFFIRSAQVAAMTRAPHDSATAERCGRILARVYDDCRAPAESPDKLDQTLIVAAWFRRRPDDLQGVLTPQAARKIVDRCGR